MAIGVWSRGGAAGLETDGPCGVLTVAWLQSVGMCGGRVAGVAGAALEAVVVLLLLAVADAVHAVGLHGGVLRALDVHLCTQREKNMYIYKPCYFGCCRKTEQERGGCLFPTNCGHIY